VRATVISLVAIVAASPAAAQPPAPAPPAATQAAEAAPPPPPVESYTYQTDNRRDPFISLLRSGADVRPTAPRGGGSGIATWGVNDIAVRGVLQSRDALVAMIQGPDNKTLIVRAGDKLLDGAIKTVTPQGLVIVQDVNDPLSVVKQREVRKLLRSLEDAK
jgi:Tfp pilus assembly protein PilP